MNAALMSTAEVAEYVGVHENTVRWWRHEKIGPRSIKLSQRRVRYRPQDVEEWLESKVETAGV